jgi:osmotically inducible protein OsmC
VAIDAEVDLKLADGGYFLSTRLSTNLPGVDRAVAQALVDEAHRLCPYSKVTRGNIDVAINLVRAKPFRSFGQKRRARHALCH